MPESKPLVSILIVNWNGGEFLGECLDSLLTLAYSPREVIVVDNHSTDNSLGIISKYPQIKTLLLDENYGFAIGNNRGAAIAQGKYIATLNNDMVVEPDWLDEAVDCLERSPRIGIISCRQMGYFDREKIDGLGHYLENWLGMQPIGCGQRVRDDWKYHQAGFVISANGGSAIYRRELFERLGGFDERFTAYCEESDLCFRALLQGWKSFYVPGAVVYHRGAASYLQNKSRYYYYRERNRLWFLYKSFPLNWILLYLPFILWYEARVAWVVSIKFHLPRAYLASRLDAIKGLSLFKNDRKSALAVFKRHRSYIRNLMRAKILVAADSQASLD